MLLLPELLCGSSQQEEMLGESNQGPPALKLDDGLSMDMVPGLWTLMIRTSYVGKTIERGTGILGPS